MQTFKINAPKKGRVQLSREREKNIFAATERRLYELNVVAIRIDDNKEDLFNLENQGIEALKNNARSFVSLIKPGMRLDKYDVHEAQINYLKSRIASDEREIFLVRRALRKFSNDPYYGVIERRYFKRENDVEVGKTLNCDATTVYRNRIRIVSALASLLYDENLFM
ncbi:MAG: hypothetical protein RRY79_04050 [Clostridia bacterium]